MRVTTHLRTDLFQRLPIITSAKAKNSRNTTRIERLKNPKKKDEAI
jgi:hypothetical protein